MKANNPYERYHRQMLLQEFGEAGQQKLLEAKVLVIGAGGLGCPVLQYLAAAGIGTLGIVDDDIVALSNLHRQVLYSVRDIGLPKAEISRLALQRLNPDLNYISYHHRLTVENALEILQPYDIIVDGTDNFSTRYMINDACVLLDKPLVYGAISQFEGQLAVFSPHPTMGSTGGVNYRDLFPTPPKDDEVLNCAEAGVLGILPGIIGTMMANETIKLITGIGTTLVNRLLTYNALNNHSFELQLTAREGTRSLIPADRQGFKQMNYDWLCASPSVTPEIGCAEFNELLEAEDIDVIDVRELHELPEVYEFYHQKIPLSRLTDSTNGINAGTVVVFCQSGKRSRRAALLLSGILGPSRKVYSLKGGIENWKKNHQTLRS